MSRKSKIILFTLIGMVLILTIAFSVSVFFLVKRNNVTINENEAYSIAIKDAGVDEDYVEYSKCNLESEDGVYVYEVEFIDNGLRYEYEIKGNNGRILSVNKEKIADIS